MLFAGFAGGCSKWSLEPKQLISGPPVAKFTVSNNNCIATCTVTFTNESTNATSYEWDFGDGSTSTQTNPSKQYTQAGTFTVKLTANSPGGSNTAQQTVTISSSSLNFVWQRIADFPGLPRSDAGVFVIGNKAYLAGGNLGGENQTDELWEFDAGANRWNLKRSLPRRGAYATGFAYNNIGYLTGMFTVKQAVPGEVLVYNQSTDQWATRTDSRMNRTFCSACVLGDKAYIGVGQTNDGSQSVAQTGLLEYNMSAGSSALIPATGMGSRLDGRLGPVMFPYNGKCIIGGGALVSNDIVSFPLSFVEFNPNSATKFDGRPDMSRSIIRFVHLAGRTFGFTESNTQIYEYKNDNWELLPSAQSNAPPVQIGAVGFSIGNTFYLGLGSDQNGVRNKEVWTLKLN
ncbi:hypothetical protein GCM10023189_19630 [Nibrella saemangeumensis]|uniref:PKD domain-containing protein n=1 Tax=Nibrella saemangeumensis TaxID=1084526 RepID=A0ABP8MPT6_9BACT